MRREILIDHHVILVTVWPSFTGIARFRRLLPVNYGVNALTALPDYAIDLGGRTAVSHIVRCIRSI